MLLLFHPPLLSLGELQRWELGTWMKHADHADDFSCSSQAEAVKRLEEAAGAAGLDPSGAEAAPQVLHRFLEGPGCAGPAACCAASTSEAIGEPAQLSR